MAWQREAKESILPPSAPPGLTVVLSVAAVNLAVVGAGQPEDVPTVHCDDPEAAEGPAYLAGNVPLVQGRERPCWAGQEF